MREKIKDILGSNFVAPKLTLHTQYASSKLCKFILNLVFFIGEEKYFFFFLGFFFKKGKVERLAGREGERAGFANSRAATAFLSQVKLNQILLDLTKF